MINKMQLRKIPNKYKFEYMRSFQLLMDIRDSLDGFIPRNETEQEYLKKKLAEYRQFFKKISDINGIIIKKR